MEINLIKSLGLAQEKNAHVLIIPLIHGEDFYRQVSFMAPSGDAAAMLKSILETRIKNKDFEAKKGETLEILNDTEHLSKIIVLFGLGKKNKLKSADVREHSAKMAKILKHHKKGEGAYISELKKAGKIQTKSDEEFSLGWVAHKLRLFGYFKEAIPAISRAFPDRLIIVRPHPSENHDTWRKETEDLNNVHVLHEGNVISWLMAADVVVHNGCTTGLETFMLERPVIAYQPVVSEIYDAHLPNRVSDRVYTLESLIQGIRRRLNNPVLSVDERSQRLSYLRKFVSENDGKWACNIIVDHLWNLSMELINERKAIDIIKRNFHRMSARAFARWEKSDKTEYNLQKFPGLSVDKIKEVVAGFSSVTGRFSNIECFETRKWCFIISKN